MVDSISVADNFSPLSGFLVSEAGSSGSLALSLPIAVFPDRQISRSPDHAILQVSNFPITKLPDYSILNGLAHP
jgi:hypothetical protein